MSDPRMTIGHNKPPINPPEEGDFLDDLRGRYPEVEAMRQELLAAAKTFPAKLADDETAGAVQDLYRKMAKHKSQWESWRKLEKGPWAKIADIAFNFFKKAEDELKTAMDDLKERHTVFAEAKAEAARLAAEEKAKREREEAARLQREAEEAEARRVAAEHKEREAREREEQKRLEAEAAERRRQEAEEAAARAKAEEQRIAAEKRERERAQKEENAAMLREIKRLARSAEKLSESAADADLLGDDAKEFDDLILEGGQISLLGSRLINSHLLDDDQRQAVSDIRAQLVEWRTARSARMKAKEEAAEAKRRQKAEAEREAAEAAAAAERAQRIKEDEERAARARQDREAAEAAAAKAKAEEKAAKQDVRTARAEAHGAVADQKAAGREEKLLSGQAVKTENRAARMENKLDNSSDADLSRTRGEFGSVGSLSGKYVPRIVNAEIIPLDKELRGYLHADAIDAAITRWQRDHQREWNDDAITNALPGVVFDWVPDSRIV